MHHHLQRQHHHREHPAESLRVYRQWQISHRMDCGALRRHPGQEVAHQERCQRLGPRAPQAPLHPRPPAECH